MTANLYRRRRHGRESYIVYYGDATPSRELLGTETHLWTVPGELANAEISEIVRAWLLHREYVQGRA